MFELIRSKTTPEQRRFIKFCVVGGSGVVVNLAFVWLGRLLAADLEPRTQDAFASAFGIVVSVFGNFLLNDLWTWGDRDKGRSAWSFVSRVLRYYLVSSLAIGIQYGAAMTLRLYLDVWIYTAQSLGIVLGTGVNYAANNRWTFGDRQKP